jgi:HD-GYP domain-containing protein (c-di-GMP phosphodiesterase class II)
VTGAAPPASSRPCARSRASNGLTPSEALAAVPLFRRLTKEHIASIARAAVPAALRTGELVIRQGETGQALYVLISGAAEGRVAATAATRAATMSFRSGDYFGESAVLEPAPSDATVVTTEATQLLVLTQVQLVAEMRRDPELAIAIARESARLARGAPTPAEVEELRQLRAQVMMYATDLKQVYDEERTRAGELRESLMDTIRVLINAVESKDPNQVGHGSRVARYAQVLARQIGWDEEQAVQAAIGGLIHDIGRVSLRDVVARKRGPMTREEIAEERQHPELGARLLRGIRSLEPLLPYVLSHHENFDGTGYPERLRGQDIPIAARLIAVADAFDELRAPMPSGPEGSEEAVRSLRRLSGDRLDPELLTAFVTAYRSGKVVV